MKNFARICCSAKTVMMLTVCMVLVVGLVAQQKATGSGSVVAEKTDPATGARWVLVRDGSNAAGSARWVLATGADSTTRATLKAADRKLVIHAGERIVVEERTEVLDARFEATALTGAESNGPLRARLTIGGRVLSARAIAPGLAEIEEETR